MRIAGMMEVVVVLVALSITVGGAVAADLVAKLEPVGGVSRMFNRPMPLTKGREFEPVVIRLSLRNAGPEAFAGVAAFRAEDVFGKPVDWAPQMAVQVPADGKWVQYDVLLEKGMGYFSIFADVKGAGASIAAWTDLGVIPEPHPGIRENSLFSSNTSGVFTGEQLDLVQAVGMKVMRAHFQPPGTTKDYVNGALPLDFTGQDAAFAEAKEHGVWVLPIVGYALQGVGVVHTTELARKTGMYGPPDNFDAFVKTWEQILRHYPEITTYEVWNEPWIFGWTWAAPPDEWRRFQKMWCKMALKVNPNYRIITGNSTMFVVDHIEHDPGSWKGYLKGTSTHPYGWATGQPTFRSGEAFRAMDYGAEVNRRMGLKYFYLTEGGTEYQMPRPADVAAARKEADDLKKQLDGLKGQEETQNYKDTRQKQEAAAKRAAAIAARHPVPPNNIENARKAIHYAARLALAGGYQSNNQWHIGYGSDWTKPNTGFAVLTHFLEDRPPVAEIWPRHELLCGGIFANPKFATGDVRALPRANELSARWEVPVPLERSADKTKVALIWSYTGPSENNQDKAGTITLTRTPDLRAFDMSGREIRPAGNNLALPFNESPVYITSDQLSVVELRSRIADAAIDGITPVNLYAQPLLKPVDKPQDLIVRVENQMNRDVEAKIVLKIDGRDETATTAAKLASGALADVPVAWPGVKPAADNQYGITLTVEPQTAEPNAQPRKLQAVVHKQIVQAACFVKRTIKVDGSLDDWQNATPVVLDSRTLQGGFDPTQYLLNPHLDAPTGTPEDRRIVARVYTAYDDRNVYVAAAVNEDAFGCTAGTPVEKGRGADKVTLPYLNGMPDGLNHVVFCGDMLQLCFGFRDRVPSEGRQPNDAWAWKGYFCDTDYVYNAHSSTEGDKLIRQWGADTPRRNAYQCESVPGVEPVRGAVIKISRDEAKKLTVYEMAIPRGELKLFDPAKGRFRFGFLLQNGDNVCGGSMNWSEAAGVFDYWRNMGSYCPTWTQRLACQTFFGVE